MSKPTNGFFDLTDGITRGKGVSAMLNSRDSQARITALFGGRHLLPSSVMRARKIKPDAKEDEWGEKRSYKNTAPLRDKLKELDLPDNMKQSAVISGKGCAAGALSIFPQDIGRTVLIFYTEPGDVVVDPFAGHNSRMSLCVKEGRHYKGCDLSTEFMDFNRKKAVKLRKEFKEVEIELHHCDSRKMPIASEIGDFTITCYDEETEVLTATGWKKFAAVSYDDEIATLNQNNCIEYQKPNDITSGHYEGPMYRLSTPFVDLRVTPNHNLYVQRRHKNNYELIQAKNLPPRGHFKIKSSGVWTGEERATFTIPGLPTTSKVTGTGHSMSEKREKSFRPASVSMDLFLEFLGYWLAEGSLNDRNGKSPGGVVLTSKSRAIAERFKEVIDGLAIAPPARIYQENGVHRVHVHSRRLWKYLAQFGYSSTKYIPRELLSLSKRQLHILFDALMAGDGSKNGNRYWTVSEKLRDDVTELAFKLGYVASYRPGRSTENQRIRFLNDKLIKSNHTCWIVHIKKERTETSVTVSGWKDGTKCSIGWEEGYNGTVRCVSVPNQVIYVRRNGKPIWCGNSPPYYDIEHYGDEPEQMANCPTYEEFLESMQLVMNENFRCLKPGAYAAWFINDFRRRGVFHSYHSDVINLGRQAGFVHHDIIVVHFGRGFRDCFVTQTFTQKIVPKSHEYCVVFRKPEVKEAE